MKPRLCRFADILGEVEALARDAFEARVNGTAPGPITGLKRVDAELGGALPPGPSILLGNTGTGKTAFSLQVAASCQCPALYVSCEMSPAELLRRHMARVCSEYLNRFKSGEMPPDEVMKKAHKAAEAAPLLSLVDATRAYASPVYLRDVAEIARGDSRHLLIIIDSLHAWVESSPNNAPEYDSINAGLAALRTLSYQLACPMLIICELNRASMKAPDVNSGAGTRRIEYGAETVIILNRKEDAHQDGAGEVEVNLKFAKNRHGAAGKTTKLLFNGALQRFKESEK
jgi:replicative DNA helicase